MPSHALRLTLRIHIAVLTPHGFVHEVWPLPLSIASTYRISVDFSSSPYLDVSVQVVPSIQLCIYCTVTGYCPAGFPHSDICGYNDCLRLPAAFRSLPRPSSAPGAKAFALRPYSLDRLPLFACFDSPANDKNFYLPFRVLQSFLLLYPKSIIKSFYRFFAVLL